MCRCDSCHRALVVVQHIVYPNREHGCYSFRDGINVMPGSMGVSRESIDPLPWRETHEDKCSAFAQRY